MSVVVVDLAFELSYLLSDQLGVEVEVLDYEFNPEDALLCVIVAMNGEKKRACIHVKACKGLTDKVKQARCLSKTLTSSEKLVKELAEKLKS